MRLKKKIGIELLLCPNCNRYSVFLRDKGGLWSHRNCSLGQCHNPECLSMPVYSDELIESIGGVNAKLEFPKA